MSEKSEALRLADALSAAIKQVDADDDVIHVARWFVEEAAAELRRLHDEVESLRQAYNIVTDDCRNLTEKVIPNIRAQRDALLAALRRHVELHDGDCICEDCAAIKAVEEGK